MPEGDPVHKQLGQQAKIREIRAFLPSGGVDFSEKPQSSWLNGTMATPLSGYPEYHENNLTWGRNVVGSFVVEVEAASGEIGVGVSTGGVPACWLVENHLAKLVAGRAANDIETIWDVMWRASLYYGRKGLAINAVSAIDLAVWDLVGKLRGEPVSAMLSSQRRDELPLYATTPRPDLAEDMGFIGAKLPLPFGPADGDAGLHQNFELADQYRAKTAADFFLAFDAWMALDVEYAKRLVAGLAQRGFWFLEDFLLPDDYWGFAEVRRGAPEGFLVATGEHESTYYGFKLLIDLHCCDIIQPDVTWCGGMTELRRISEYAKANQILLVPHASSVYGYQFMMANPDLPFGEFVNVSDDGSAIVPIYGPLFVDEPVPKDGKIRLSDKPGFGVALNRQGLVRPFARAVVG